MKKLITLVLLLSAAAALYPQSQLHVFEDWTGTAGTQNFFYKNVTKTDGSGNVYVAGATVNGSGTTDILVAKYSSGGTLQWIQQYNGLAGYYDFATALAIDGSSNVYVAGAVSNDTLNPTTNTDMILIKYNSSGVQQWVSTYAGPAGYFDAATDLYVAAGGIALTGSSMNSSLNMDYVTILYNNSGVQQWATVYDHSSHLNDVPVKVSRKGSSILVGGAVQTGAGSYDWAVLQYNTSGVQTAFTSSTGGSPAIDSVFDMMEDADGNIYIAGSTLTPTHGYDYDLVKLDSNLVIQWEKTYDGADHLDDVIRSVKADAAGNVYVTGLSTTSSQGTNYLTQKYNSAGTLIWSQTYNDSLNGDDEAHALVLDNAETSLYVTGFSYTDSLNGTNYYTLKYDSSGVQQWAIAFDGSKHLHDKATNIALDTTGNVIVTGESEISTGMYEYATVRYVEKQTIVPADFNNEPTPANFLYYANKGQLISTDSTLVPDVRFYTNSTYPAYYFKDDTLSMVFSSVDTVAATDDTLHRIDLSFPSCNEHLRIYPLEEQSSYLNYFLGHCPQGVTEIHGQQRLVVHDLYDHIDLVHSSNQNGMKYYFIVKPGGDPDDIHLKYTGANSTSLSSNNLTITSLIGSITLDRPFTYQLNSSNDTIANSDVYADWHSNGSNNYDFDLHPYDSTKVLVIEVDEGNVLIAALAAYKNLTWSTYYGGDNNDQFSDLETDNVGDVYAAAELVSHNFPTGPGFITNNSIGAQLAAVVKFNRFGVRQFATYYGVVTTTQVPIIRVKLDVDSHSNAFLTGEIIRTPGVATNIPFPPVPPIGAYVDNTYGGGLSGGSEIFLAKFNSFGTGLLWTTYYGSANHEALADVNIDPNDDIYLTFYGSADSLLHKPGGYWDSVPGGSMIIKFTNNLHRNWATQISCGINSGAFDKVGNFFASGIAANGGNYPWTNPGFPAYFDTTITGTLNDIVIAKFGKSSSALEWFTSVGGSDNDAPRSIAIDKDDNIYITGETYSSDFPFNYAGTGTYIDSTIGGSNDVFMLKFNSDYSYKWGSYFGGSSNEHGYDVETDPITGQVFFTGYSAGGITLWGSTPYFSQSYSGGADAFIATFTENSVPVWATYLGYSGGYGGNDIGFALTTNNWNQLFVAGSTGTNQSGNFLNINPGGGAWFNNLRDTYNDAHISRFTIDPSNPIGIHETIFSTENFMIYPNPSNGMFNYTLTSNEQFFVMKIYNLIGQLIYIDKVMIYNGSATGQIDLNSVSNGVYFITIESATKKLAQKIVKQ